MDVKDLCRIPPWEWPQGAGGILLAALTDQRADASTRLIAAELAGEIVVMSDEMAAALLALVQGAGEPEELRRKAAIALGPVLEQADLELIDERGFDDPEAVPISLETFRHLQDSLHQLFLDESLPQDVRRRILEASVRAPQEWHQDSVRDAYSRGVRDWKLTAVFAMRWVPGFDTQILEALGSADAAIHLEAVLAAGDRELDAAWPHVLALVRDPKTPKDLLLAAIEALGNIRPKEAGEVLVDLTGSEDEEIADAANEAMSMADSMSGEGLDEDDEGEWVN